MGQNDTSAMNRRGFIAAGAALLGTAAVAQQENSTEIEGEIQGAVRRNISSFRALNWQPYFASLNNGAILVDIQSRALHYWNADESVYKLYPTSVPVTDDLTRRGETSVVEKVVNPTWRPTPAMRERNPEWPEVVEGGAPNNPLGPLALYLSWQ